MKILYLTHQYFPRHIGGTEIYTQGLARRAMDRGNDVHVITCHESECRSPEEFHRESLIHEGIPVTELHFNLSIAEGGATKAEFDNSFVAKNVAELLHELRPDVVHIMHPMKLSAAAISACTTTGVPTILSLSDYWAICPRVTLLTWDAKTCTGPDRPFKCLPCVNDLHNTIPFPSSWSGVKQHAADVFILEQRLSRIRKAALSCSKIVALSKFQKDQFLKCGYPENRIDVLQHGVETVSLPIGLERSRLNSEPYIIGFVGSLVAHKGPQVLIEALSKLPAEHFECHIFGEVKPNDPFTRKLKRMVANDHRIKLKGQIDPSDLGKALSSIDLLCVPSTWYENEPLIVKAGLAMGLPMLVSKIGSLQDMISEGQNGWLVKAEDSDAWAEAIKNRLRDKVRRLAPSTVKSMDTHAIEIFDIYDSLTRRAQHATSPHR